MTEDNKTIAQIAAELGVTRQAVYQKIKNNSELSTAMSQFTVKKNNTTLYNLQAQQLIKQAFESGVNVNCKQAIDSKQKSIDSKLIDSLQATIATLQTTIETLTNQLAVKDKQIEYLQDRLTAEQALHAGTIQQKQQTKVIDVKAAEQPTVKPQRSMNRSAPKPTPKKQTFMDAVRSFFTRQG